MGYDASSAPRGKAPGERDRQAGQAGGPDSQRARHAGQDGGYLPEEVPATAIAVAAGTVGAHPALSSVPARMTASQSARLDAEIFHSLPHRFGESCRPALRASSVRLST